MKYIIIFLYWLITWLIKILINFVELIWHLDTKHFSYYNTYFLSISQIKQYKPEYTVTNSKQVLNFIERLVYSCVK